MLCPDIYLLFTCNLKSSLENLGEEAKDGAPLPITAGVSTLPCRRRMRNSVEVERGGSPPSVAVNLT